MKFVYTRTACIKANTPALRETIQGLTEEAYNNLIKDRDEGEELPDVFMSSFEHDGQTYVIMPGKEPDTIVVDTATMIDAGPIDVPEGHPFHGKSLCYPEPDSLNDNDPETLLDKDYDERGGPF